MKENNRELTEKERKMTEKGVKLREDRLIELKADLEYNQDLKIFQDKHKEYINAKAEKKKQKEYEYLEKVPKLLEKEMSFEEEALKKERLMLTEGVPIKRSTGINWKEEKWQTQTQQYSERLMNQTKST